ncbi:hypothetical protein ACFL2D_01315 [Patescibacteria group bacterium]
MKPPNDDFKGRKLGQEELVEMTKIASTLNTQTGGGPSEAREILMDFFNSQEWSCCAYFLSAFLVSSRISWQLAWEQDETEETPPSNIRDLGFELYTDGKGIAWFIHPAYALCNADNIGSYVHKQPSDWIEMIVSKLYEGCGLKYVPMANWIVSQIRSTVRERIEEAKSANTEFLAAR